MTPKSDDGLPAGIGNVPDSAHEPHGPRRRRRWPYVVGFCVLLVGGLIAIAPSLISGSWLNGVIRQWLEDNVATPVTFDKLDVSWSDGVRITGLSVSDRVGRESPLFYAREVELEASILKLFTRQLDVERFVFRDAVLHIEHEGGGRLNSEDVVRLKRKKREEGQDGQSTADAFVLPHIDAPIDIPNLTLVFVTEDGRRIERPGIEFHGDITTRDGPTTFALTIPGSADGATVGNAAGALTVEGEITLFDADGALLPSDKREIASVIALDQIDASRNADLLALLIGDAPASGLVDGKLTISSTGRNAKGEIQIRLSGLAVGEAVGAKTTGTGTAGAADLEITGRFETDGSSFVVEDGRVFGSGIDATVNLRGPFDAIEGAANFEGDLAHAAAALRTLGMEIPDGLKGRAAGNLEFGQSPSRGTGIFTVEGLHVPPLADGAGPLDIERAEARITLVPEADRVVLESATLSLPAFNASATGVIHHDGTGTVTLRADGDVAALLAHGRTLGVVPRDLALGGRLGGAVRVARATPESAVAVIIEGLELANDGMRIQLSGGLADDGTLDIRLDGKGSLESLIAARRDDDGATPREVRGTFDVEASVSGTLDAPLATVERLVLAGDLSLEARGTAEPDGSVEGSLSIQGAVPDAISLARGLGLVEGDVPLEGTIDARVALAGTRDRPQIPNASLSIGDGPVVIDATATLDFDGLVRGSFRAVADLDALWRVAYAQGFLQRELVTGGMFRAGGVIAGTRSAIEISNGTALLTGPMEARINAEIDSAQDAAIRCKFEGSLAPVGEIVAAALGIDAQRVVGTFDGAATIEGPLDALKFTLSDLGVRSGAFTANGRLSYDANGAAEAALVMRGPIASMLDVARMGGVGRDIEAGGDINASIEVRLSGNSAARSVVGAVTMTARDLRVARTDDRERVFREEEISLTIPAIRYRLDATASRPLRATLAAGQRLKVEITMQGGAGGQDVAATAAVKGSVQPLLNAIAFAAGGVADNVPARITANVRVDGPPDALRFALPDLAIVSDDDSLNLQASAEGAVGRLHAKVNATGDAFSFMAFAHAVGVAPDSRATGRVDLETELNLDGDTLVVSRLAASVDDLRVAEPMIGEGRFSEPHFRMNAEEFSVDLATRAVTGFAPSVTMDGFDLVATVETTSAREPVADSATPDAVPPPPTRTDAPKSAESSESSAPGPPARLVVTTRGKLRIEAAFVANHPELFADVSLKELELPFTFKGDVSDGRAGAATWTGTFDATLRGLAVPYADVASATAKGVIADGAVTIEPFNADVNGGTARGSARIGLVGEKPEHALTLHAENIAISGDLAPLLARVTPILAVGDAGTAGGRFGVDTELTAKGLDAERIKRTISGDGTVRLAGVYVESDNWIGKLLEYAGAGSRLDVADADVPFKVRRGHVTTSEVDMVGSGLNLRFGGEVDTDGKLNYSFKVKPNKGGEGFERFAQLLDDDGYLPLRLEGNLASPKVEFPSLTDIAKGGLGGFLDGLRDKLNGKDDDKKAGGERGADKRSGDKDELTDEERKQRRRERRKRKKQRAAEEAARNEK